MSDDERLAEMEVSPPTYEHKLKGDRAHGIIYLGDRVLAEAGLLSLTVEDQNGNVAVSIMTLRNARRLRDMLERWIVRREVALTPRYKRMDDTPTEDHE